MTPYRRRQTPITKRMAEDMLVRNLAARTIDAYTFHVDRFARHFGKLPEDLGPEQIREYQLWMIQVNDSSWSQFNQAVCALRFLYSVTIPRDWAVPMIPFGKRAKKLPTVLGQDEVHDLIQCVTQPKQRAVLLTLYAAGLSRLIEVKDDRAYFRARSKDKSGRRERVSHSGVEFMRHWCLHILPKGFTKVRCYGGWSCTRRGDYLLLCASLSPASTEVATEPMVGGDPAVEAVGDEGPTCPQCERPMELESEQRRPSWRELFYGPDHPSRIEGVSSG